MPTYEYQCDKCKAVYELRQSFSAENSHTCEECGKGTAKRVLHVPRVVFKGSGFYATDSRKSSGAVADNKPAPAASESTSAPKTEATADGGSKGESSDATAAAS